MLSIFAVIDAAIDHEHNFKKVNKRHLAVAVCAYFVHSYLPRPKLTTYPRIPRPHTNKEHSLGENPHSDAFS
jgi:hypothetical protein